MNDIVGYGLIAACILMVLVFGGAGGSGDCWTDWDGRSNSTVCD